MKLTNGVRNGIRAGGLFALGLAACVGMLSAGSPASAGLPTGVSAAAPASKIDPSVLQETRNGKSASFIVLLSSQADVSSANNMKDHDARGWYVYNTLRDHATRTQADLRQYLSSRGISHQAFWAANMVELTGDLALAETLAARTDVASINSNRSTRWIESDEVAKSGVSEPVVPGAIEWGVNNVRAPEVWALGYTGQGIVVSGMDTGIRWTHNAIKSQYRGWNGSTADHNYNWWDSIHSGGGGCGANTQAPCDDNGHGTHTVGTAVGWDGAGNNIGVAYGSKWMGCRNMNVGNGTPATYTECFQFMIAPTDLAGQNANPALRPHVTINSWGCPVSEGCVTGDELRVIVENTQAAGIFVQASAGNAGPNCSTVNDAPGIYEATFSTGSITISNAISSFSSRGPVTLDGSGRLKPNIVAPGSNVRSALNSSDTAYGTLSGTSMAGPHVSGVIALLWSARPALVRDIAATKALLQNTANPNVVVSPVQTCGGIPSTTIPNNTFGYGRVDAMAAVSAGGCTTGTSTVNITNFAFTPQTTTITAGSTINWTNSQGTHNSVSTSGPESWNSGTISQGGSYQRQFNVPGTYQYVCTFHPGMEGTITVTGPCPTSTVAPPTATIVPPTSTVVVPSATRTVTAIVVPSSTPDPTVVPPSSTAVLPTSTSVLPTVTVSVPTATSVVPSATAGGSTATSVVPSATSVSSTSTMVAATGTMVASTSTMVASTSTSVAATGTPIASTSTPTSTPCTVSFTDVAMGDTFYEFIRCLACRGIISGYTDGTFRPNNAITRAQIAKMVSNSAGFFEPVTGQSFEDVPTANPFYVFIERLYAKGHMSGYACGTISSEPCIGPNDKPYFRPFANATRGQLSKIVANAASMVNEPDGQFYADVPESNPFYVWIGRLTDFGSMSGYPCGGPGEPCDAQSRPYFRWANEVTRGQASKIVSNTFFPDCVTPRP